MKEHEHELTTTSSTYVFYERISAISKVAVVGVGSTILLRGDEFSVSTSCNLYYFTKSFSEAETCPK